MRTTAHPGLAWLLALGVALLPAPPPRAGAQPLDDQDHTRTGFPLTGGHERTSCESCHVRGIFEGTPTRCGVCHSSGGFWQASGKPSNHVPSSEYCGDCHITASWAIARFDHTGVTRSCVSCHNGLTATGKSPGHAPSSNDCEACHRTIAWSPAAFDHSLLTGSCFSCHNGVFATGKPATHVPSSNDCEICHDTRSWETSGGFDHSGIVGSCVTCHDGSVATGKPASHFFTSFECDVCHATSGWLPIAFTHSSPAYPGDHAGNLDCTACHLNNSQAIPWPFGAYQPDCAGCHADAFRPDFHRKVTYPPIFYSVDELRDCTGACHRYADPSLTTIDDARSGEHRVNQGGW